MSGSPAAKQRAEILQMALLKPKMCILDETDPGLDIDALKLVSGGRQRAPQCRPVDAGHHPLSGRLLDHIVPDVVHVFSDGKIVESTQEPGACLKAQGYANFDEDAA